MTALVLDTNANLSINEDIYSKNGRFKLVLQGDGNLVLYDQKDRQSKPIWASNTAGRGGDKLVMQGDGHLVLYDNRGGPLWASGTSGRCGKPYLSLQDSGNLILESRDKPELGIFWQSFSGDYGLEPGVYTITSKSTGKCVQLDHRQDGSNARHPLWYWTWVKANVGEKIYPDGQSLAPNWTNPDIGIVAREYWLISPHPEGNGWVTITSLYYGSFLGLYKDERAAEDGHKWLQGAPASVDAQCARWKISSANNGEVKVSYRMDQNYEMAVDGNGWLHVDRNSDSANHKFVFRRIELRNRQTAQRSSWMSKVPDDFRLSQINLPATHQTLALLKKSVIGNKAIDIGSSEGLENPRCQVRGPYQQLLAGIRMFDCRFNIFNQPSPDVKCLYAWHGSTDVGAPQGYTCGAMLQSVSLFLKTNPQETVIISIGDDPGATTASRKEDVWNAFYNDAKNYSRDLFYYPGQDNRPMHMNQIDLGSVRGKIVLVHKNSFPERRTANRGDFWTSSENRGSARENDGTWLTKWQVRDIINQHKNNLDKDFILRIDWNASILIVADPWNVMDRIREGLIEYYGGDNIGTDGKCRTGIVNLDFYEMVDDAVWNIIRSNRGCGHL